MTEEQWLSCSDPKPMLDWLCRSDGVSDRKLRLFGVGCCRRLWGLSLSDAVREAIRVAEAFADGQATPTELGQARERARWHARGYPFGCRARAVVRACSPNARLAAQATGPAVFAVSTAAGRSMSTQEAERTAHCGLLRCVFGSLALRPTWPFDPSLLRWNGGAVIKLAEDAYARRETPAGELDAARLLLLADALTDAGCTDAELLAHLRSPGPHVRGCWALDAVLARG